MIFGMGMLELGVTFGYGQLVIDDYIVGVVNRILNCKNLDRQLREVFPRFTSGKHKSLELWGRERALDILRTHLPPELDPDIKKGLREIIQETQALRDGKKPVVVLGRRGKRINAQG